MMSILASEYHFHIPQLYRGREFISSFSFNNSAGKTLSSNVQSTGCLFFVEHKHHFSTNSFSAVSQLWPQRLRMRM